MRTEVRWTSTTKLAKIVEKVPSIAHDNQPNAQKTGHHLPQKTPHPDAPYHQFQHIKSLSKKEFSQHVVMDDERYFTFSGCRMLSNVGFYSSNVTQTPWETKKYPTKTFESKVMIWCAVFNGVSRVHVAGKGEIQNRKRYQSILKFHLSPVF